MKYELPIAIALLAAGGWLWFYSGWTGASTATISISEPARFDFEEANHNIDGDSNAHLRHVNFQQDARSADESKNKPRSDHSSQRLNSSPATASPESISETTVFLQAVGASLRNSPPFQTNLLVQLKWAGQDFQIAGEYAQPGQGSGKSKIELHIGDRTSSDSASVSINKVCDGRFLYTLIDRAGQQTLEFIDLRRVQESRLAAGLAQANNPTSWIATGGIASLFENLAVAFEFDASSATHEKGADIIVLEGKWNLHHLAEMLNESVAAADLKPEIQWEKIPPQIPHQVRIEMVNTPSFGWMPQRIDFFRLGKKVVSQNRQLLASIQFSTPLLIAVDPQDFMKLKVDEVESIDATDLYVDQVRDFGYARQAQSEAAERLIR